MSLGPAKHVARRERTKQSIWSAGACSRFHPVLPASRAFAPLNTLVKTKLHASLRVKEFQVLNFNLLIFEAWPYSM